MTEKQRNDLYVEWEVTSTKIKNQLKEKYIGQYGAEPSGEHWENFLVDALNLRQSWESSGLS